MKTLHEMGALAKKASRFLMTAGADEKNRLLHKIADLLIEESESIIKANKTDLENGEKSGLSFAMLDRLMLNEERIEAIAQSARYVAGLNDPIGVVLGGGTRPNGLSIVKKSTPIGVAGIIFESRPNVTVDCAVICLKSGNAAFLRGGSEAINSNKILCRVIGRAVKEMSFPEGCVQLLEDTSRETAREMMKLGEYIDVLIPRGGEGLIRTVVENATIPVIETGAGNCHIYADKSADINMAVSIIVNAKTSRPSVCNAAETLLVHKDIAEKLLPVLEEELAKHSTEIRACELSQKYFKNAVPATENDWKEEYKDYIIAVKAVENIDEAIDHIDKYSTKHSEVIITNDVTNASKFTANIDSAAVYVNASSRFTDGGEFGLGAEIGISTQKLHARGPMGLEALTSYKYIITGNGQIR